MKTKAAMGIVTPAHTHCQYIQLYFYTAEYAGLSFNSPNWHKKPRIQGISGHLAKEFRTYPSMGLLYSSDKEKVKGFLLANMAPH
ncbi:hypothetical protein ACJJIX_14690 [Microbulbifer sp. VAAC004]|uniref:hypothetical protein n=1 Tax=unclassified Microbulbifer TaxID=2619833 RepID=UPI004039FD38